MKCSLCNSKVGPASGGVEAALRIMFKIYRCIKCGTFVKCKKCEYLTYTTIGSITHVFGCHEYKNRTVNGLIEMGKFNGHNIALNLGNILREIPYFFLLAIDFDSAFKKLITYSDISNMVFTIIPKSKITEFASIIKKSIPSCPFCGRYYETFPTEDIVINHCIRCKI